MVSALGLVAYLIQEPCLAPPLGVSAFALLRAPHARESQPRAIVLGHLVGLLAGWSALIVCGQAGQPSALQGSFTPGHAAAAGLAVGGTIVLSARLRATHPPALATTLVASLGLLASPVAALALWLGAAGLAVLAWARNGHCFA